MRIQATVTLFYDQDVMDKLEMSADQFQQHVNELVVDDFNGGIEFTENEIDVQIHG